MVKTKIGHVSLMYNMNCSCKVNFSYCFVVTKCLNASGRNSHKGVENSTPLCFYFIKLKPAPYKTHKRTSGGMLLSRVLECSL